MNRERMKELMPIMQAFVSGKSVQFKGTNGNWHDCPFGAMACRDGVEYRVKPEVVNVKRWDIINADNGEWLCSCSKKDKVQSHLEFYKGIHPKSNFVAVELTGSYER